MASDTKVVSRYHDESSAYAAQALLEASGVASYVFKDDWGGMKQFFRVLPLMVELRVAEDDLGKARDILNSHRSSD